MIMRVVRPSVGRTMRIFRALTIVLISSASADKASSVMSTSAIGLLVGMNCSQLFDHLSGRALLSPRMKTRRPALAAQRITRSWTAAPHAIARTRLPPWIFIGRSIVLTFGEPGTYYEWEVLAELQIR